MTVDIFYADATINTKSANREIAIQTESSKNAQLADFRNNGSTEDAAGPIDWDRLAAWMDSKYPMIKAMLDANNERGTFANYEVIWDDEREEIVEQYAMRTDFDFRDANIAVQKALNKVRESEVSNGETVKESGFDDWDDNAKVSQKEEAKTANKATGEVVKGLDNDYQAVSLSWNVNGSTLAVAYGKTNHTTWCEHCSVVSVFNVFRRDFNPKKATVNIEVSNCVSQVSFHPTDPLILAGGTVNGEIYLWNVNSEEYLMHVSAIDEYFHREAICKLIWVRQENLNLQVMTSLVSTSTDGKILVWRYEDKLKYPIKGYLLGKKKG